MQSFHRSKVFSKTTKISLKKKKCFGLNSAKASRHTVGNCNERAAFSRFMTFTVALFVFKGPGFFFFPQSYFNNVSFNNNMCLSSVTELPRK